MAGLLSPPQDDNYEGQLRGILGNLGQSSIPQMLIAAGAGLAGNATRGWGAGIGAGLQGANDVLQNSMSQRAELLGQLMNAHARQQQLALSQGQLELQKNALANNPDYQKLEMATAKQQLEMGKFIPVQPGTDLFNAKTGTYMQPPEGGNIVKLTADAIQNGNQPPLFTNLGRGTIPAAVKAELERRGVNVSNLQQQWDAAHKQILSLNGPQMVRYAGLSNSVINTIDEVTDLAKQMDNSGLTAFNAAKLGALVHAAGNTSQGQLAAKYLAATNTLKEEFANLAQGGFAPTEAAWGLANQQINGNYGVKELQASLGEVQRLLRYRLQGIPNMQTLGPGAANQYIGNGQPQGQGVGLGGNPAPAAAPGTPAAQPVRVNTPEEAMKLPSGTPFVTPDGRLKVRP